MDAMEAIDACEEGIRQAEQRDAGGGAGTVTPVAARQHRSTAPDPDRTLSSPGTYYIRIPPSRVCVHSLCNSLLFILR